MAVTPASTSQRRPAIAAATVSTSSGTSYRFMKSAPVVPSQAPYAAGRAHRNRGPLDELLRHDGEETEPKLLSVGALLGVSREPPLHALRPRVASGQMRAVHGRAARHQHDGASAPVPRDQGEGRTRSFRARASASRRRTRRAPGRGRRQGNRRMPGDRGTQIESKPAASARAAPGFRTTIAFTASPHYRSGTPITAITATAGSAERTASSSAL